MTQRFHVGDVVRIVEAGPSHGLTTTITKAECRWGDEWQYWGPCPTSPSREGLWYDKHLEKVESVPFKLERGDRVINRKTGREGEVFDGQVWDTKVWSSVGVPVKAIEEYEEHHPGSYDLIKATPPW